MYKGRVTCDPDSISAWQTSFPPILSGVFIDPGMPLETVEVTTQLLCAAYWLVFACFKAIIYIKLDSFGNLMLKKAC
jgi:hypothetical protein